MVEGDVAEAQAGGAQRTDQRDVVLRIGCRAQDGGEVADFGAMEEAPAREGEEGYARLV